MSGRKRGPAEAAREEIIPTLTPFGVLPFRSHRGGELALPGFALDIESQFLILVTGNTLFHSSLMKPGVAATSIPKLLAFFHWLVRRSFRDLGIKDAEIADYISVLLANFARTENLYRIRDLRGRRLDTAVELLVEANLLWYFEQWDREKEIRKHIGDYILFMSGIFREWVERQSFLGFYLEEGKKAYWTVSEYHQVLYRPGSRLYRELSKNFEFYVGALNYMKKTFFREPGAGDPFFDFDYQLRGLV